MFFWIFFLSHFRDISDFVLFHIMFGNPIFKFAGDPIWVFALEKKSQMKVMIQTTAYHVWFFCLSEEMANEWEKHSIINFLSVGYILFQGVTAVFIYFNPTAGVWSAWTTWLHFCLTVLVHDTQRDGAALCRLPTLTLPFSTFQTAERSSLFSPMLVMSSSGRASMRIV